MTTPAYTEGEQRILRERAQLLAQQPAQTTLMQGEELVVFRLGASSYAVAARWVREVYPLQAWVRLPGTPSFIAGLANVRSQLLSVIDIRPLLDQPAAPPSTTAVGLVLRSAGREIVLLADSVEDVRRSDSELMGLVSQQNGRAVAWVRGLDQRMTMILDARQLMDDQRLIVDADAL